MDVKRKAVSQKRQKPQMAIEKWGAQLRLATEFVIQANWAAPQLQMNREWVVSYERTPKVCYFWSSAGPPSFLMGKPMGNLWKNAGNYTEIIWEHGKNHETPMGFNGNVMGFI